MNYAAWNEQTANITSLLLDPKNPRLTELGHEASQREIIAELLRHEGVMDLARDVALHGFFPTEILICIEEQAQLIVVEGNRRLASLKLLAHPEVGPEEYASRFKALRDKMSDPLVHEVNVVIAPFRAATAPLIMNRHTQQGVKAWERIQQARYVSSLLQSGASLQQLVTITGSTKGDLLDILRTNTMYEIANNLSLEPKIAEIVRDPRKFNASTMERVIESTSMREFLGIRFDEHGGITGSVHPEDFKRAYKRIVEDIATEKINTRILNNRDAINAYIKKISSSGPQRKGTFTSGSLLGKTDGATKTTTTVQRKALTPRSSLYLIPKTFKCRLPMPRIRKVLGELQTLKIDHFENAVAILLRIFIELSISHYMEATGKMKPLVARIDKQGKKPKTWTPSLRQMLNDLLLNDPAINIPIQARKALNKAVADDDFPLSLDGMDQFAHNPYLAPTERQLRQLWNVFEKLLEFLMEEHGATTGKKVHL